MKLEHEILTPNEILAKESSVNGIMIPALWGQMDILPEHTDYITELTQGELAYRVGKEIRKHNISGGFIAIKDGKATVMVDGVLATVTPINAARAQAKPQA